MTRIFKVPSISASRFPNSVRFLQRKLALSRTPKPWLHISGPGVSPEVNTSRRFVFGAMSASAYLFPSSKQYQCQGKCPEWSKVLFPVFYVHEKAGGNQNRTRTAHNKDIVERVSCMFLWRSRISLVPTRWLSIHASLSAAILLYVPSFYYYTYLPPAPIGYLISPSAVLLAGGHL